MTRHRHDVSGATLVDALEGLTARLVTMPEPDYMTSVDGMIFNVTMQADSCAYEFNTKDMWVSPHRWSTLVRQYIDPVALDAWLDLIEAKLKGKNKRGVSFLRTQMVQARGTKLISRRWGSCMIGFGFHTVGGPELTLHSRTSYLGGVGQLDIGVAHHLARLIGERLGLGVDDIAFTWQLDMAAFHMTRSLSWYFKSDEHRRMLKSDSPIVRLGQKHIRKMRKKDREGELYGFENYAQQSRIRRHFHTEVYGYDYALQFEGGPNENTSRALKPCADFEISAADTPFRELLTYDHGTELNAEYWDPDDHH